MELMILEQLKEEELRTDSGTREDAEGTGSEGFPVKVYGLREMINERSTFTVARARLGCGCLFDRVQELWSKHKVTAPPSRGQSSVGLRFTVDLKGCGHSDSSIFTLATIVVCCAFLWSS